MSITALARFLPQSTAVTLLRVGMKTRNLLKYRDIHFPQQIFIEINRECNRTCVYCPNATVPAEPYQITTEHFLTFLERLKEIHWTGPVAYHMLSEPLMHPDLDLFINYTYRAGMMPILFTNGDFLTYRNAQRLVECGLARCTISLHKPFKAQTLAMAQAVVKLYPGVFRHYKPAEHRIFKSGDYTVMKSRPFKLCRTSELNFTIRYNGDYGLCHSDPLNLHSFGNAFDTPIMEAWKDPVWTQVRTRLLAGHRDFEICKACDGVV